MHLNVKPRFKVTDDATTFILFRFCIRKFASRECQTRLKNYGYRSGFRRNVSSHRKIGSWSTLELSSSAVSIEQRVTPGSARLALSGG
ncbi:hypothetical protein AK812_SmicGene32539 [Symbiodinium microadriaticum]|uniref:Uncharacterized protein n=1 Tax=Symbiodinium microadriaticum TaxID=2951 RepID=A0A1Q9CTX7_SYMMI|nr:hypothetical protein AK812_SmicGene32539 [Symbiodinium microadriaticum]